MGAFTGAAEFFGRPLDQVAAEYGYSKDNLLILQGKGAELRTRFPQTHQNIMSCQHQRDQRLPIEYAQDLVASWLIEDYFLREMSSDQYRILLDGADRKRQILPNTRVNASSDYAVEKGKTRIKLELMNNYTYYWRKTGRLDLRDSKYEKLCRSQSLLVAVAILTKEFTIFDFRREVPATEIPSHPAYGGKRAYALDIPSSVMRPLADHGIERAILELLG